MIRTNSDTGVTSLNILISYTRRLNVVPYEVLSILISLLANQSIIVSVAQRGSSSYLITRTIDIFSIPPMIQHTLMKFSYEIIHVPQSLIIKPSIANWSKAWLSFFLPLALLYPMTFKIEVIDCGASTINSYIFLWYPCSLLL